MEGATGLKNYLSFGGGVNSVAMYLLLKDQGVDFEAVFVDHGTDWPETYKYVDMFKEKYPLTVLKPNVQGSKSLYEHCWNYYMVPSFKNRWCTDKFKRTPLLKYHKKPCFVMIGFDWGERHRAKIFSKNGEEYRYPLIENEIDRHGCKDLIIKHNLTVPSKSGCFTALGRGDVIHALKYFC